MRGKCCVAGTRHLERGGSPPRTGGTLDTSSAPGKYPVISPVKGSRVGSHLSENGHCAPWFRTNPFSSIVSIRAETVLQEAQPSSASSSM